MGGAWAWHTLARVHGRQWLTTKRNPFLSSVLETCISLRTTFAFQLSF